MATAVELFPLTDEYIQSVYEQIFQLKYRGGFSEFWSYNLPIKLRNWFVQRLSKQLHDEEEQIKKAQQKKH